MLPHPGITALFNIQQARYFVRIDWEAQAITLITLTATIIPKKPKIHSFTGPRFKFFRGDYTQL